MSKDMGASPEGDRATAVEPVPVSPLRDGIPSADNVSSIPDEELLRRAVVSIKRGHRRREPRWVTVSDRFMLGSTYSAQLCRRFGFDPDEYV